MGDIEMSDADVGDALAGASNLHLDVLALTNEARNEHGLRHQDYQRYRQYCAKKIHTVRGVAGLRQINNKKKYERKVVTSENATSSRVLEILLFETERAWSYAMQLKRESTQLKREYPNSEPRSRHHLVKRLKRASQSAARLESVCRDTCDPTTSLDIQAYAHVMGGYVLLERQEWSGALDRFAAARTIYEVLASVAGGSGGGREREALCQSAIDAIDPNIRFCAYNLKLRGVAASGQQVDVGTLLEVHAKSGDGAAGLEILQAQVEEVLAKSRHEKAMKVHEISWRGRSVPSKNEGLIEAIVAAQEASAELEALDLNAPIVDKNGKLLVETVEKRLEAYGKVVGAYFDAAKIAETDIKEDAIATAKVKSSKSEETTAQLQFALSHVSYLRLCRTVERTVLLLESARARLGRPTPNRSIGSVSGDRRTPRMEDLVRFCDTVLHTLSEIGDMQLLQGSVSLPKDAAGAGAETSTQPGSVAFLQAMLGSKVALFKARRCLHLGEVFWTVQNKPAEAVALFDRAMDHLTRSKSDLVRLQSVGGGGGKKKGTKGAAPLAALPEEDLEEINWIAGQQKAAETMVRAAKMKLHARLAFEHAGKAGKEVQVISEGVENMNVDDEEAEKEVPLLVETMNKFRSAFDPANPRLIDFPPKLQPVPSKPLFFDIAFNSIEYPIENIERRAAGKGRVAKKSAAEAGGKSQKKASGGNEGEAAESSGGSGIGGFLSGIWGRK
ncbi:signal recognition particle subunit srp68 [Irineochytrium annulatum]|nr:signal recognition particle subunit srp68 [Irineochytrium annulatum]